MNESSNRNSDRVEQAKGQEEGLQRAVPQQEPVQQSNAQTPYQQPQSQQPYQQPYQQAYPQQMQVPPQPGAGDGYGSRKDTHKQPWYNQRWLTALAFLIGVGILAFVVMQMTQSVDGVNASIQEQTSAIEEQTGILAGIGRELQLLTDAVKDGFTQLMNGIRDIANQWTNAA